MALFFHAVALSALKCHRQDEARPSFPQPVLTQSYRNRRREPGSDIYTRHTH